MLQNRPTIITIIIRSLLKCDIIEISGNVLKTHYRLVFHVHETMDHIKWLTEMHNWLMDWRQQNRISKDDHEWIEIISTVINDTLNLCCRSNFFVLSGRSNLVFEHNRRITIEFWNQISISNVNINSHFVFETKTKSGHGHRNRTLSSGRKPKLSK